MASLHLAVLQQLPQERRGAAELLGAADVLRNLCERGRHLVLSACSAKAVSAPSCKHRRTTRRGAAQRRTSLAIHA
jgi:hypothetical protein